MIYLRELRPTELERGDAVTAVSLRSPRRSYSSISASNLPNRDRARGFTLIELVITITVLTILTMGVVPLLKISVKRQKEQHSTRCCARCAWRSMNFIEIQWH